ncbi:hypothetical protein RM572_00680 [Streptomyces sp. DSM 42041]|uniref:Uncharacterized protein n=1 Tax=Streptomyces hazeniae TaxID=3075538 RepID=A0ABU2NJY0_9ACTN|nr:hypothetical protein [Streptomyces sp. DSM 42041]MDT0377291.1 hypothetical protein [Streptomyces sp. DSM 42041]
MTTTHQPTLTDTAAPLPGTSSVPAAMDRGHLYSPTADITRYALDDRYAYDYQPGDLFEPMPPAPRGDGKAWAWWWANTAKTPTPDFLGLATGDTITVQHATGHGPAEVLATYRLGALIRFPHPDGETRGEMYVRRCNHFGRWYA